MTSSSSSRKQILHLRLFEAIFLKFSSILPDLKVTSKQYRVVMFWAQTFERFSSPPSSGELFVYKQKTKMFRVRNCGINLNGVLNKEGDVGLFDFKGNTFEYFVSFM